MPVAILAVLKVIGSTLMGMFLSLLTGPVIKKLIEMLAEQGVSYYEKKAKDSPEASDDEIAKFCRSILELAKKEWNK